MLKIPKFMLDLRQQALVASFLFFFHISVKVYQKKIMQLFAMLSCIIYYIYPFTFFVPINNRLLAVECYLSCIIALKNSQVRSDLRMLVEITFSTVGKLHVKLFTHLGFKF